MLPTGRAERDGRLLRGLFNYCRCGTGSRKLMTVAIKVSWRLAVGSSRRLSLGEGPLMTSDHARPGIPLEHQMVTRSRSLIPDRKRSEDTGGYGD